MKPKMPIGASNRFIDHIVLSLRIWDRRWLPAGWLMLYGNKSWKWQPTAYTKCFVPCPTCDSFNNWSIALSLFLLWVVDFAVFLQLRSPFWTDWTLSTVRVATISSTRTAFAKGQGLKRTFRGRNHNSLAVQRETSETKSHNLQRLEWTTSLRISRRDRL